MARHPVRKTNVNHVQALVLGFLGFAWLSLVVILAVAPDVYDQSLKLPADNARPGELVFLVALSAFIALVALGVLRRWRWMFWLLLVAFVSGVLRVPASILELTGILPATGPTWYLVFQALIGLLQLAIGVVMLREYRTRGVWGRRA